MKTLIIYASTHHGNTEKVAQAMAETLNSKLLRPNEVEINIFFRYDLIGFGSGIYFFKHHRTLLALADQLPIMKNKKAFIFSTRGLGVTGFYHKPLKKKLLKKKIDIVGEFSCLGWDTVGPLKLIGGLNRGRPDKKDIEGAKNFAKNLTNI